MLAKSWFRGLLICFYLIFSIGYSFANYYLIPSTFIIPFFLISGLTVGLILYYGKDFLIWLFLYRLIVIGVIAGDYIYLPQIAIENLGVVFLYYIVALSIQYVLENSRERKMEFIVLLMTFGVFILFTLYGFVALTIKSSFIEVNEIIYLSILFGLSDLFGIITVVPIIGLISENFKFGKNLVDFEMKTYSVKISPIVYTGVTIYAIIITQLLLMTPHYNALLFMLYVPIVFLTFQYGFRFSIYTVFISNVVLTLVYSINSASLSILESDETLILQGFTIVMSLLIYVAGIKTTNVAIERKIRKDSEMQLIFAQKSELTSRMAGGLVHEVNNAHQIIRGFTDLLSMRLKEDDEDRYLEITNQINSAVERTSQFMKQMQTISSKETIKLEQCVIPELITQNLTAYKTILQHQNPLEIDLHPTSKVLLDKNQFNQIMINLLSNAKDASSIGSPITIVVKQEEIKEKTILNDGTLRPGEIVHISVIDRGIGIIEENLTQIFEPFFTSKQDQKGMGLGLSIVHGLVRMNGGIIDVESEPDVGTIFHLYFPVKQLHHQSGNAHSHPIIDDSQILEAIKKIVIIDDEKDLTSILSQILSEQGMKIITYSDPLELLSKEYTDINSYDLIISDIVLPNMNGIELVSKLRKVAPLLPVVLISGFPNQQIHDAEAKNNGLVFLGKPFSINMLISAINKSYLMTKQSLTEINDY